MVTGWFVICTPTRHLSEQKNCHRWKSHSLEEKYEELRISHSDLGIGRRQCHQTRPCAIAWVQKTYIQNPSRPKGQRAKSWANFYSYIFLLASWFGWFWSVKGGSILGIVQASHQMQFHCRSPSPIQLYIHINPTKVQVYKTLISNYILILLGSNTPIQLYIYIYPTRFKYTKPSYPSIHIKY